MFKRGYSKLSIKDAGKKIKNLSMNKFLEYLDMNIFEKKHVSQVG